MRIRRAVVTGVVSGCIAMLASACTLASPTHITVEGSPSEDDVTSGDAGAKGSASSSGGAATGATCSGSFAKVDVSKLTACGDGKGHCYDKTKTPAPDMFVACPKAGEVCVPDEVLSAGGNKLKSCTSIIGPGGCSTVSLLNLPADLKQQSALLKQDVCSAGQVCTPCTDPRNNQATGACEAVGVFDKPCESAGAASPTSTSATAAAAPAEKCCTTNGRSNGICIAEAAIPEADRADTIQDTCSGTNKCVPSALANGAPVKCTAGPFGLGGSGVCLDKCFNSMLGLGEIFFGNEGCGDTEVCIPCTIGKDKGLPGCN